MRGPIARQKRNDQTETEEARFLIFKKIRDGILDETFKPGERLPEEQVGKMFNVSRSPVREVLLALEKEGTVIMEPYKGATVKPLSPEEALDIAELRLSLITLAAKPAYDPHQQRQRILRMRSPLLGYYIRESPTAYSLGSVPATGRSANSLQLAVSKTVSGSGDQTAATRGAY
jgi:DNA-binding transcriptional regulator YhcF (GntR family)